MWKTKANNSGLVLSAERTNAATRTTVLLTFHNFQLFVPEIHIGGEDQRGIARKIAKGMVRRIRGGTHADLGCRQGGWRLLDKGLCELRRQENKPNEKAVVVCAR